MTIWHSRPPHTVIGQVCRGEKVGREWTPWSPLFSLSICTSGCNTMKAFQGRMCKNVRRYLRIYAIIRSCLSLWLRAFHGTFPCGHSGTPINTWNNFVLKCVLSIGSQSPDFAYGGKVFFLYRIGNAWFDIAPTSLWWVLRLPQLSSWPYN